MAHSFKNLKIVRESVIETGKHRICFLTRSTKKPCLRFLTRAFVFFL